MIKNPEAPMNSLFKLSNEIKNAMPFSTFTESQWRLAYLHAMAFFEDSMKLIAAIEFVELVSETIETNTTGVEDDTFAKFNPLMEATIQARAELHQFADEIRGMFDEHYARRSSLKPRY